MQGRGKGWFSLKGLFPHLLVFRPLISTWWSNCDVVRAACFLPMPQELEENVVYVEKEDEFDVVVDSQDPEGHRRKAEKEQQEEEAIVSIEAIDTVSRLTFFSFFFSPFCFFSAFPTYPLSTT